MENALSDKNRHENEGKEKGYRIIFLSAFLIMLWHEDKHFSTDSRSFQNKLRFPRIFVNF